MIHFKPVERHIHDRDQCRLCDGRPVGPADISSEDIFKLRDARRSATIRAVGGHCYVEADGWL